MTTQTSSRIAVLSVLFYLTAAATRAQSIAILKGDQVLVQEGPGLTAHRIDSDDRPKSMLRWNAAKKILSYMVPRGGPEKARFVMISPDGRAAGERVIRPDPSVQGLRFVESFDWLPNGSARVGGSINPRNCETFDFDPDSQLESNYRFGACNTDVYSPDGKHVAWLGMLSQTDEEHQFNTVDIDSFDFPPKWAYAGGSHDIFVLSGPVWDPNSEKVAILERRADTGEIAVVIIKADRSFVRIPVSRKLSGSAMISWPGRYIVLADGSDLIPVDTKSWQLVPFSSDVENDILDHASKQGTDPANKVSVDARIAELGASEGVDLTTWP